jgi:hypothetical protein
MGYQFVSATIDRRTRGEYFVFNCEIVVRPNELEQLRERPVEEMFADAQAAESISDVELREPWFNFTVAIDESQFAVPPIAPLQMFASRGPFPRIRRPTNVNEGFVRFSAFPNDYRIRPNGSVIAGACATTVADSEMVPSGFAAVGRYALPNPASARFVYIIVPGPGVLIDGGTVRPNHLQAGGGVEIAFVNGAPAGSAFVRPYTIPEL